MSAALTGVFGRYIRGHPEEGLRVYKFLASRFRDKADTLCVVSRHFACLRSCGT